MATYRHWGPDIGHADETAYVDDVGEVVSLVIEVGDFGVRLKINFGNMLWITY